MGGTLGTLDVQGGAWSALATLAFPSVSGERWAGDSLPPRSCCLAFAPRLPPLTALAPPQPRQARVTDGVGSVWLALNRARNFGGKLNRVQENLTFFPKGGSLAHSVKGRGCSRWSPGDL